jgi:ribosome-interacting GTPase 1
MPMPHRIQMQLIKRRLVGKEGAERVRELRAILTELPDYRNGPYADIRKWVNAEIAQTRTRARVVARDSIEVRRQGAAQIALVGPPNVGKSSLLQALSDIQIAGPCCADTERTTMRLWSFGLPCTSWTWPVPSIGTSATAARGRGSGDPQPGTPASEWARTTC